MQGSNSSGERGRLPNFFESQDSEMRVLGWLDAFRAVKLALKLFCEKASLRL